MDESYCPKARNHDLTSTRVGNETVIYDFKTDKGSCLDGLTTTLWEICDGQTDITLLLDKVRCSGYQDITSDLVWLAIDQLDQAGLLEEPLIQDLTTNSTSRREMLRLLRVGAMGVLPMIATVNIQPAIAQISGPCTPKHGLCSSGSQCCSGICHPSGKCG